MDNTNETHWQLDYDLDDNDFIAVIGVSGRFPEAATVDELWKNLLAGRDCLHTFTDDELDQLGIPSHVYSAPNFIRRGTRLPFQTSFDYRFFGFTPKEAEVMDPQSRIFLEEAYSALENAGIDPLTEDRPVGVFAGSNPNDYSVLQGAVDQTDPLSAFDRLIGSDKDFLATRLSHRLNLTGPALTLQTACSTSLVAVHLAVQSLLSRECTVALAGGVTVNFRQGVGYFYQDGMILSPTGECRAFDAEAAGTTLGQGCGVVVLKRLADAVAEGDNVLAVVRGSSINNDGSDKAGYTAPSVNGQSEAIEIAQEIAEVAPETITYIEAHGTGTKVGDPIEIAGLTRAFERGTDRKQFCGIGSVKSNVGHLDAAAGIAGFIKAVMAIKHGILPASIHYSKPNPDIEFEKTPFYVNDTTSAWLTDPGVPRRAGVSAFGIGGTNAHVILEEPPVLPTPMSSRRTAELLVVSARTKEAVGRRLAQLGEAFQADPALDLGHVAATLRDRRAAFPFRTTVAITGNDEGPAGAIQRAAAAPIVRRAADTSPLTTFLFSGQGAQYVNMGRGLYESSPAFAGAFDHCADLFLPLIGTDLRGLVFAPAGSEDQASRTLRETAFTQPALFAIEYAAAQMLSSLGVTADAVVGHSIGEYAAAVHAGIMSVEDATLLVARRGQLMQSMEPGSMLSVSANMTQLPTPPSDVELAADNARDIVAYSGPTPSIESFKAQLDELDIRCTILRTSHAFHSAMMEAAVDQFETVVGSVTLSEPSLPMASNVTGTWITPDEATDPAFWASQIRRPVLFRACIATVAASGTAAFIEVGPGRPLVALTQQNNAIDPAKTATVQLFRSAKQKTDDWSGALAAVGSLWSAGVSIDWYRFRSVDPNGAHETMSAHVALPSYPFERNDVWGPEHRHILAMPRPGTSSAVDQTIRNDNDKWLYAEAFKRGRRVRTISTDVVRRPVVLFAPATPTGAHLTGLIQDHLGDCVVISPGAPGSAPTLINENSYSVDPSDAEGFETLVTDLLTSRAPGHIIHAWMMEEVAPSIEVVERTTAQLESGVLAVEALARLSGSILTGSSTQLDVVTTDAFELGRTRRVRPGSAALTGTVKVLPIEFTSIAARHLDLAGQPGADELNHLVGELAVLQTVDPASVSEPVIAALRDGRVWTPWVALDETSAHNSNRLKQHGSYLIVGGLGGVGLSIAEHLARKYSAKLTLTSRSGRPTPDPSNPELSHRLAVLDEIEGVASGVEIVAADASDLEAMTIAFDRAEEAHGHIDGVIVAAGLADQRGGVATRSRQDSIDMMAAKVHGSVVVLDLAASRDLDFVLLSSSIASTLYHNRFGQISYVTGNTFAQAAATAARADGIPAVTVAWDDWKDMGMSVRAAANFRETYDTDVDLVDALNSFTPSEGVAIFEQALRSDESVLHVSPTDLQKRIIDDVHAESPFLAQVRRDAEADVSGSTGERPTDVRQAVLDQWVDKIGVATCADDDDFSALGGDSLQLARVATRLSSLFGVSIPLNALTANQEFGAMVEAVAALVNSNAERSLTPLPNGSFRLGPAQYRFLDRRWADSNHFNISALLERVGGFDAERPLRTVIDQLGERHPMLRSNLIVVDEDIQNIISTGQLILDEYTVTGEGVEADAELLRIAEDLQRSLDLSNGPACRLALFRIADGRSRLLLIMHHMVSDRMSLFTILHDLDVLLGGADPDQLVATEHYSTWVNDLADLAAGDTGAALVDRWVNLPWDGVVPAISPLPDRESRSNKAARQFTIRLTANETNAVLSDTPDLRIINALGSAVAQSNDGTAAVIERLSHGRESIDLDVSQSVGFFLQYEPFVVDANLSPDEQLQAAKAAAEFAGTFDALRFYGSDKTKSVMAGLPRADVLFNYVGRQIAAESEAAISIASEACGQPVSAEGIRAHPLSVIAEVIDGELELRFVYSSKLQTEDDIQALAEKVRMALTSSTLSV
jgi:acyl transferase domain-containing protein/acyl carrier protein